VVAPAGFWKVMLAWTLLHALIAAIATTAYSHRLIAHRAAKDVRLPTHVIFLGLQLFALQGSVRRWSAQHVIHHAVDKTGQHHLDPYSTTWFDTGWRNFLWSHMLTYLFNHPPSREFDAAMNAKMHPAIIWQDKHYVPLLILANFALPIALGLGLAGWLGGFCLLVASSAGYVLAHHNTWTVNSVTHLWGFKKGLISSAKNNYIWLGPLGEGNHHADHHDHPRDFRNGFGWSGWVLDPTRYVILSLRALGLVKGLNRASRWQEAHIITRRKVRDTKAKSQSVVWQRWEEKLALLGDEWLAAAQTWDQFKLEKIQLSQQIRQAGADKMAAARERMGDTQEEFLRDLQARRASVRAELHDARKRLKERREAFFTALSELKQANMAVA
jgi:stearoyl-CoA desaturase (delta-9 desaturase)